MHNVPTLSVALYFISVLLCLTVFGTPAQWKTEELGVPVRAVTYGNSHAVIASGPGGNGRMFYTSYYCTTGAELIGYDFRTDTVVRHKLPSNGGYGLAVGPDGAVYVGGVYPGDLYRYDTHEQRLSTIDVKSLGVQYIWDAAVGNGWVYCAAGYPRTKLAGYEVATGKVADFGEMVPGEQYLRAVCVDLRGNVWCGAGTRAHLVVRSPDGKRREALPTDLATNAMVMPVRAFGNYVVAVVNFEGVALVYNIDRAEEPPLRIRLPGHSIGWELLDGGRGETAYFQNAITHELYRCNLRNGKARRIIRAIGQCKIIEEDRWIHAMDDQDYVLFDLKAKKEVARKRLKEGGDGMQIYSLSSGPNGDIYGSTYINMRLFRYSLVKEKLQDLGKASRWPGQIDSLSLGRDGRLYIGAYIHAVMSAYDPGLPWNPGPREGDNPCEIGPLGKGQYRTHANTLGPDGMLYVGSIPSYNSAPAAAFTICNPKTGHMNVQLDFVQGGAINSLVSDDKLIYGAGGGDFFAYDPESKTKLFSEKRVCASLAVLADGRVLGSGDGKLFIYDRNHNRITRETPHKFGDFPRMASGSPGVVFGVNKNCIARMTGEPLEVQPIASEGGAFAAVDGIGRVYFARGASLFRCSQIRTGTPDPGL